MLFSFLFISQILLRFYRFLCATWLWVLLHLLTNLLSSIDRKQICPEPYFREYYIFIEMKLFLSIVIIYVQFNNLVVITFLFLSFSLSFSPHFFPFFSSSLSRISMILDKLRHKIISSSTLLCPAVSHLMMETSQNDFFFSLRCVIRFCFVHVFTYQTFSDRISSNDY